MRSRSAHLIAAGIITVSVAAARAATWDGDTDTAWTNNANWVGGTAPSSSTLAVFDNTFTTTPGVTRHQPAISSFKDIGGIWMTGNSVLSVEITSAASATFQANGATINGTAGLGILIDNTNSSTLTINTTSFKLDRNQTLTNNSNNLFTIAAPVNLATRVVSGQTVTPTITVNGSGDTLMSNALTSSTTSSGHLVKSGAGTLTLSGVTVGSGSGAYRGSITVEDGTLLVTGSITHSSAAVTATGGTVGGTGTIARTTIIGAGGTLAPGAAGSADRRLDIDHSLSLAGTTAIELFSTSDYEQVFVNTSAAARALTFGGTLTVTAPANMAFAAGDEFKLFDWGANTTVASGNFATINLPALSGGLQWKTFDGKTFDPTTGTIVVVPEPASLGVLGAAGLGLLLPRRRASRAS
jgi:autotransporter-associated beta strand protein